MEVMMLMIMMMILLKVCLGFSGSIRKVHTSVIGFPTKSTPRFKFWLLLAKYNESSSFTTFIFKGENHLFLSQITKDMICLFMLTPLIPLCFQLLFLQMDIHHFLEKPTSGHL